MGGNSNSMAYVNVIFNMVVMDASFITTALWRLKMTDKYLWLDKFLLRTAHPLEPFPYYKPHSKMEKIHWFFIKLRWKMISLFVKYKSPLNGKTAEKRGEG